VCSFSKSLSFAAVREALSNVCPDKEVPNKTTVHRLVTKFRNTGNVCVTSVHRATKQLKLRPYRFQVVHQLQQRDTAARI
jgi:cobalamin biosynthesis Co2+ chelatase CbiK